ncbi:MAG: LCP family protein [bacterium]|nr:LCP family protein [bacterium]
MHEIHAPNFLERPVPERHPPPPLARTRRIIRAAAITLAVLFVALSWSTRSSDPNPYIALRDSATVRTLRSLITNPTQALATRDNRIHVLLIGIGGAGHEGPLLADTILIASMRPDGTDPVLVSVPRDLLLPLPDGGSEKANAIHAYAEDRDRRGAAALRDAIAAALGIDIPYYVRVDFRGFSGLVDTVDGVDVLVERTLDDPLYPITGKEDAPWEERYEHLVIPAGVQHLDGTLALKYVRSRHGRGAEGSDFARARRQQQLLRALRARLIDTATLTEPRVIKGLLQTWRQHLATNLDPPELLQLAQLIEDIDLTTVQQVVLTDDPTNGVLTAGRWNGAYVLRPRGDDYAIIQATIARALNPVDTPSAPQRFHILILNGTAIDGLAQQTADALDAQQYAVVGVGNAPSRAVDRTVIYYQASAINAARPAETIAQHAAALARQFNAVIATTFPALPILSTASPDILIVLGGTALQPQADTNDTESARL